MKFDEGGEKERGGDSVSDTYSLLIFEIFFFEMCDLHKIKETFERIKIVYCQRDAHNIQFFNFFKIVEEEQ